MANPVVHFEIGCRDREGTAAFFQSLFGWTMQSSPFMDAIAAESGGIAGHITALGHEPHQYVTVYVEVEDISSTLDHAVSLGGRRILGPIPIPTGSFAWFQDPGGNTIGLMQRG